MNSQQIINILNRKRDYYDSEMTRIENCMNVNGSSREYLVEWMQAYSAYKAIAATLNEIR